MVTSQTTRRAGRGVRRARETPPSPRGAGTSWGEGWTMPPSGIDLPAWGKVFGPRDIVFTFHYFLEKMKSEHNVPVGKVLDRFARI